MAESDGARRPWGMLLTLAGLAMAFGLILKDDLEPSRLVFFSGTLTFWGIFLTFLILGHPFWGAVAGVALVFHPIFFRLASTDPWALWSEAFLWIGLAGNLFVWKLVFLTDRFFWGKWLLALLILVISLALALPMQPRVGFCLGLLSLGGLLLATRLGVKVRGSLSKANLTTAAMASVLAPGAGFLMAHFMMDFFSQYPRQPNFNPLPDLAVFAWKILLPGTISFPSWITVRSEMDQWFGSMFWFLLALMILGWWRSFTRGFRLWNTRPPLAWVLTFFTLINLGAMVVHPLGGDPSGDFLGLASLILVLAIFSLADFLRGIGESLVLAPPEVPPRSSS